MQVTAYFSSGWLLSTGFFSLLKRERIRRRTYPTREDAKADVFDYIERFYNRWRRHAYLGYISPVEFENQAMKT